MEDFEKARQAGVTTMAGAIKIFDQLEGIDLSFMTGLWKGSGFHTNHFLDGVLEAAGWFGKSFEDKEHVHPLLFNKANRKGVFAVDPGLIPIKFVDFPIPENWLLRCSLLAAKPLIQTVKSKARLRMIDYRGKTSVAMIYDDLPIIDFFRKVDSNKVLGLMDLKTMPRPFFFVLTRVDSVDGKPKK